MKKIQVIGAGFSGLVTSWYLLKKGFQVEILESQFRPGGLISTFQNEFGLVETAANGVFNSALFEDLAQNLELPLLSANPESKKRYILRNKRPRRWPLTFFEKKRLRTKEALNFFTSPA